MSPRPPADSFARPFEVAIVGNDAVLAALPSRTMQLAHALHACGFDLVVPVSWGEELVAREVLGIMAARDASPAIFCACPLQRARLLSAGSELASFLVSLASPTVAAARYVRAMYRAVPLRITAIGGCPGLEDPAIDYSISALELNPLLDARGVVLADQSDVFESVIPPDRRRYFSLPGGCPAPRMLEMRVPDRRLVTITDVAFADELGDVLLGGENVLVDLSPRLACACCGGLVTAGGIGGVGRDQILRHEPPRAPSPSLEQGIAVDLSLGAVALGARGRGGLPDDDDSGDAAPPGDPAPDPAPDAAGEVSGTRPSDGEPGGVHAIQQSESPPISESPPASESPLASDSSPTSESLPAAESPPTADRASLERPRIAVTPAAAVRRGAEKRRGTSASLTAPTVQSVPPPASAATGDAAAHAEAMGRGEATERTSRIDAPVVSPSDAVVEDDAAALDEAGTTDAKASPEREGEAAQPRPGEEASPWRGDVAVPLEPTREGMPPIADESPAGDRPPWSGEGLSATSGEVQPAEGGSAVGATSRAERAPRARGRAPVQRFHLGRAQSLPRALSLGGKVLPRAYIRHLAPPGRWARQVVEARLSSMVAHHADIDAPVLAAVETSALLAGAQTDMELRLEVSVEPVVPLVVSVAVEAGREVTGDERSAEEPNVAAGRTQAEATDDAPTPPEEDAGGRSEGVTETEIAPPAATAEGADILGRSTATGGNAGGRAAGEWSTAAEAQAVAGAISDDVRARVRQRQRAGGRVVSRELPPTHPPREPGSLLVIIASAILVLALLVALAVIFRRLPTAPW